MCYYFTRGNAMDTRMSKYDNEDLSTGSRVKKNAKLYETINNNELNDFTLRSNATVIGNQENEIDVEKIKRILDTRYKDVPKRKSIRIEQEEDEEVKEVPTKEYDLNVFLEKAKDEKPETYEEVRAKKLRDTQFDILKNLKIDDNIDEEEAENKGPKPEDNDLLNLINTITMNEAKEKKAPTSPTPTKEKDTDNPAQENELFMAEALDEENKAHNAEPESTVADIKKEITKVETTSKVINKNNNLDNSFYTSNNVFTKKDFSDDEEDNLSLWIKILIVIIIVGVLVGLFLFLKSIINV